MSDSKSQLRGLGDAAIVGGVVGGLLGAGLGLAGKLAYDQVQKLTPEQQQKVVDGVIEKVLPSAKSKK
jgi:hypothetical protein